MVPAFTGGGVAAVAEAEAMTVMLLVARARLFGRHDHGVDDMDDAV